MARVLLSVAVMHAPWSDRGPWVQALRAEIEPRVGKFTVVTDDQREGPWPTAQRAWQAHSKEATHICVLQDDVQVVRGFIPQLLSALAVKSDVPVGLCSSMHARSTKVLSEGGHWLPMLGFYGGQGQVLPVWFVKPWLRWGDKAIEANYQSDDVRLALYLLKYGVPMWWTVPSLAQHLGDKSSVLGHHVPFADRVHFQQDLPMQDWTRGAGKLPVRINTWENIVRRCRVPLL